MVLACSVHLLERSLLSTLFGKISLVFLIHFFLAYSAIFHMHTSSRSSIVYNIHFFLAYSDIFHMHTSSRSSSV